jgi:hypothetical protein
MHKKPKYIKAADTRSTTSKLKRNSSKRPKRTGKEAKNFVNLRHRILIENIDAEGLSSLLIFQKKIADAMRWVRSMIVNECRLT